VELGKDLRSKYNEDASFVVDQLPRGLLDHVPVEELNDLTRAINLFLLSSSHQGDSGNRKIGRKQWKIDKAL
jgi:hypothetical protein